MLPTWFKRWTSAITAVSVLFASTLMPLKVYGSDATKHKIDPYTDPYFYESRGIDQYSRAECARTRTNACEWQHVVPLDYWEEVASMHNPRGEDGLVDGRELYEGERWMAVGMEAAGILGLKSADIVYKTIQQQVAQPTWVIARYLPEKAELRIHAVKVIKTPDGYQRVLVADYTPDHGRWHVVWRHFLRPEEKRNLYVKGIDPYKNFSRGINTKTFVNVSPGAAQAIMGQAMMHYKAPFALFIEPQLRLKQWQVEGGNKLRKKITTHTQGFAKPLIYLAAPMNMTQGRNSSDPRLMGMYCPRDLCQTPDELVYAGVVLEHLQGGNVPEIEERLFYDTETKKSWGVLAYALLTAALTWGVGAAMATSGSWAFAGGFVPSSTLAAGAGVSASTITAAAGLGYVALNAIGTGADINDPQRAWFASTGWKVGDVTNGVLTAADASNKYAQKLYTEVQKRHIQSGRPGTAQSAGNLQGTNMMVQGNCPIDWGIKQCEAAGLDPGQAPRKDMHTNRAFNTTDYKRKTKACQDAGYGYSEKALNYCLATAIFYEKPVD